MTPKLHRYLWLLTGRCDNFANDALNSGIRYDTSRIDDEVREARQLLCLDATGTDYYVVGAMAALYMSRTALKGAPGEESVIFLADSLHVRAPEIAGGSLQMADARYPSLIHRPKDIPVARTWTITYQDPFLVTVTADNGLRLHLSYRRAGSTIYINWPAEVGFNAAFSTDSGTWQEGDKVVVRTEPSGYPYEAVARKIRASNTLVRLMAQEGTLQAFHSSLSGLQKVGALAAAVVLRNIKLTPSIRADLNAD